MRNADSHYHQEPQTGWPSALEKLRDQLGAAEVSLWQNNGVLVASVSESGYNLQPDRPSASEWRQLRSRGSMWRSEGLDESNGQSAQVPRIKLLYKMQGTGFELDEKMLVLQIEKKLPPALVANAMSVLVANREYQERALARNGLERMYIGT